MDASIDIGVCINRTGTGPQPIFCLGDDGLNFCCQLPNSSVLIQDTGERACCSLESYLDLQWATLGSIQVFLVLLTTSFIILILTLVWIFLTSFRIKESEVKESRREVVKHLLRNQMLHKSRKAEPSVVDSLKNLSTTLSSSRKGHKRSNRRSADRVKEGNAGVVVVRRPKVTFKDTGLA